MNIKQIKELSSTSIFMISILASIIIAGSISAILSIIFHGYVTTDYMITSFICSSLVASVIVYIILELTNEIKVSEKKLMMSNQELLKASSEIKTLRGIIPICSYCKKIRDDKGSWSQLEAYIHTHSEAVFSHGACPGCYDKIMANMDID